MPFQVVLNVAFCIILLFGRLSKFNVKRMLERMESSGYEIRVPPYEIDLQNPPIDDEVKF